MHKLTDSSLPPATCACERPTAPPSARSDACSCSFSLVRRSTASDCLCMCKDDHAKANALHPDSHLSDEEEHEQAERDYKLRI